MLSLIWTFYFVPETKGRTLEAMDQYVFPELKHPLLDNILSVATQLEELPNLTCLLYWVVLTVRFKFSVFKDINSEQEESRRRAIESEIISNGYSMPRQEGEVS